MILIESIKTRHVDGPTIRVAHIKDEPLTVTELRHLPRMPDVETEVVRGERFVTAEGAEIELGMTRQVRAILGLPAEAFRNLHREHDDQARENRLLRRDLVRYQEMTWRQRLAFLFKKETT